MMREEKLLALPNTLLKQCILKAVAESDENLILDALGDEKAIYDGFKDKLHFSLSAMQDSPYIINVLALILSTLNLNNPSHLIFNQTLMDCFLYNLVTTPEIYSLINQKKQTKGIRKIDFPDINEWQFTFIFRGGALRDSIVASFCCLLNCCIPSEFNQLFAHIANKIKIIMYNPQQPASVVLDTFKAPRIQLFNLLHSHCVPHNQSCLASELVDIILAYDDRSVLFK